MYAEKIHVITYYMHIIYIQNMWNEYFVHVKRGFGTLSWCNVWSMLYPLGTCFSHVENMGNTFVFFCEVNPKLLGNSTKNQKTENVQLQYFLLHLEHKLIRHFEWEHLPKCISSSSVKRRKAEVTHTDGWWLISVFRNDIKYLSSCQTCFTC